MKKTNKPKKQGKSGKPKKNKSLAKRNKNTPKRVLITSKSLTNSTLPMHRVVICW